MASPVVSAETESASRPSILSARVVRIGLWVLLIAFAVSSIRSVVHLIPAHRISGGVMGQWFYLDYSQGFVRRALPGELLSLIWVASPNSVEALGWAISFVAVPAVVLIAIRVGALSPSSLARLAATTLVLISPLGLTTILRDPGRMDFIGMVVMALMLLLATLDRVSLGVGVGVAAIGVAVAVACEEFLIAFIAPVVVALVYVTLKRRGSSEAHDLVRRCVKLSTIALLPAFALVLASWVSRPSAAYLDAVEARSNSPAEIGAVWEMRVHFRGELHWVFSHRGGGAMAATAVIWICIYAVTVLALRILIGRLGAWYWVSAIYFAMAAALSMLTIDYRRWFTLGLIGHLVVTGILGLHERRHVGEARGLRLRGIGIAVVVLAFVLSLYGQSLPNTVRPSSDPGGAMGFFVGRAYGKLFPQFWFHGHDMP